VTKSLHSRRVSHYRQSDPAERTGSCLRRCPGSHLQRRCRPTRSGALQPHTCRHLCAHAGKSIRPRCRNRVRKETQSLADRRLLRRARLNLSRTKSRNLRRSRDRQLLSCSPHHHGRRRVRLDRQAAAAHAGRILSRLGRDCWCAPGKENTCGKRFDWQLGELPHATITNTSIRTLAIISKPPTCRRPWACAVEEIAGVHRREKAQFCIFAGRAPRQERRRALHSAGSNSEFRSQLVWISASAARDGSLLTACSYGVPARQKDRDSPGVRRQPDSATCICWPQLSRRRRSGNQRRVMNQAFWVGIYPGLTPAILDYVWNRSTKSRQKEYFPMPQENNKNSSPLPEVRLGSKVVGPEDLVTWSPKSESTTMEISISPRSLST